MRVSVIEVLAVVVLSLSASSVGIKTWSVFSQVACSPGLYVAGTLFSMLICSLLLLAFASVRAWRRAPS